MGKNSEEKDKMGDDIGRKENNNIEMTLKCIFSYMKS